MSKDKKLSLKKICNNLKDQQIRNKGKVVLNQSMLAFKLKKSTIMKKIMYKKFLKQLQQENNNYHNFPTILTQ